MKYFNLLTPFAYWMLILMWSYILYFYLRRILCRGLVGVPFVGLMAQGAVETAVH